MTHIEGYCATQSGQLPVEVTNSGLASVRRDRVCEGVVGDSDADAGVFLIAGWESVSRELLGEEMSLGDGQLLLLAVPGNL